MLNQNLNISTMLLKITFKFHISYYRNHIYNLHANIHVDYRSLIKYKEIYGNLMIPQDFRFNDEILLDLNGSVKNLGLHVKHIRNLYNKNKSSFQVEDKIKLDEIGFIWNSHHKKFEWTIKGLCLYKEIHGNLIIPYDFVVPNDNHNWDSELWGLKLGKLHHALRSKKELSYKREVLKDCDVDIQKLRYDMGKLIAIALETYSKLFYPNLNNQKLPYNFKLEIRRDFVIPFDDTQWPKSVWGMKLGLKVFNIKYNIHYKIYHNEYRRLGLYIPHLVDKTVTLNNNDHK